MPLVPSCSEEAALPLTAGTAVEEAGATGTAGAVAEGSDESGSVGFVRMSAAARPLLSTFCSDCDGEGSGLVSEAGALAGAGASDLGHSIAMICGGGALCRLRCVCMQLNRAGAALNRQGGESDERQLHEKMWVLKRAVHGAVLL